MDERTHYATMQAFASGVRAIVAAIQAGGPAIILPRIGRGPISDPLPDLTEDEVRKDIWGRSERHVNNMQDCIDFIGERMSDE